jgi:hypothetical protein
MMVPLPWTGWHRSRREGITITSAATTLFLEFSNGAGKKILKQSNTNSTLSIPRVTWTFTVEVERSFVFWMGYWLYSAAVSGVDHNLKQFGARLTVIRFHVSVL